MANEAVNKGIDSSDRAEVDTYDRGIIPAETAARMEREGDKYKTLPTQGEGDPSTEGYTVDKEGLLNNYAVEPEMYYEEPGDASKEAADYTAQRVEELGEINQDKEGKLTEEGDKRGRGPGVI
jgi:hypothetical protein